MNNPIAVFDSGLGGLTVVRQLIRRMPLESIVYFGDTARVPYGIKSAETITRFAQEDIEFLEAFQPKLMIAACNTASAVALPRLDAHCSVPLLGVVEPGARAAVAKTRNRRVGVIGTEATINSGSYSRCIKTLAPGVDVIGKACPLLVPLVEEGRNSGDAIVLMALEEYLAPLKAGGVDTVVLGCTHYPLLKAAIRRVMGPGVSIVDSALETARAAAALLAASGALAPAASKLAASKPDHTFFASDSPNRLMQLGRRFLGGVIESVGLVQPELIDGRHVLRAVG